MSQNRVTVILDGIDKLSPMLKGLGGSMSNLGAGSVFMGNMMTKAFETAASSLGALTSRFSEASDMQQSMLKLGGQFGAMTNLGYEKGTALVKDLNAEFATMVASLPGSTQDFKDLGLAISDTLIKSNSTNGVFNQAAFKEQALSLTKTLGLLKDPAAGIMNSDIQLFFTKFAEGASESELRILKLNERMPGLMGELDKATQKLYGHGKKTEELSLQQRVKVFEVATKNLSPDAMIADLEKTAGSQIEALKTAMFDQDTGLFGFLRVVENGKNVMDGFGEMLAATLGKDGLFGEIGEKLSGFGLKLGDPMKMMYSGIMTITMWIKGITSFLDGMTVDDIRESFNLNGFAQRLSQDRATLVNNGVEWARSSLTSLFSNGAFAKVGQAIGAWLNAQLTFAVTSIQSVDFTALGVVAAQVAVGLLDTLEAVILSIDYYQIAQLIGDAFRAVEKFAAGFAMGIASAIASSIAGAAGQVASWVVSKGGELVEALKSAMTTLFDSAKNSVVQTLQSGFSLDGLKNFVTGSPVQNRTSGQNVTGLFDAINREVDAMPSGANVVVANSSEAILNQRQQRDLVSSLRSVPVVSHSAPQQQPTSKTFHFAPQFTVNASQSSDARDVANVVLRELESKWTQFNEQFA